MDNSTFIRELYYRVGRLSVIYIWYSKWESSYTINISFLWVSFI